MAGKYSPRDDLHPPSHSKRFTSFAAQIDLVNQTDCPKHAPCLIEVEADAGEHLDYIDGRGTANALTFIAAGNYVRRMSPFTIETTTNVNAITVFWMPEP